MNGNGLTRAQIAAAAAAPPIGALTPQEAQRLQARAQTAGALLQNLLGCEAARPEAGTPDLPRLRKLIDLAFDGADYWHQRAMAPRSEGPRIAQD